MFARSGNRILFARVPRPGQAGRRLNSTTTGGLSSGSSGSNMSQQIVAGLVGGGVVVAVGYGYYHYSGLKSLVQTSKQVRTSIAQATENVKNNAPEAFRYLRSVAQSYAKMIPGASTYVDTTFDTLDDVANQHSDEFNRIVRSAIDEINSVTSKGGADLATGTKVFEILQKRLTELTQLSGKAGGDALKPILERNPELRKKYDELKRLAESQGPEVRKKADELRKQIQDTFKDGFSPDALVKAKKILQERSSELYKLVDEQGQKAWDKAIEQAGPAFDKLPDVKNLLNENRSKLTALVAGGGMTDIFKRISDLGKAKGEVSKEKVSEVMDMIEKKVEEGSKQVVDSDQWEYIIQFVRSVPYGDKVLDETPYLKDLVTAAREEGDEAKKLAQQTYEEVLQVLRKRGEDAKKLADKTKDETKNKAQQN